MQTSEREPVTEAEFGGEDRSVTERIPLEQLREDSVLVRRMSIRSRIEEMLEDRSIEIDAISEREWTRQQRLKRLNREKQTRQMY